MALTRRQLRDMHLDSSVIESIIAAHSESVQAVARERDEARAELEGIRRQQEQLTEELQQLQGVQEENTRLNADFAAYRTQVENDRLHDARQKEIRRHLLEAGANPQAVELLMNAVRPEDIEWQENRMADPEQAFSEVRQRYAAFFAQPTCLPTLVIAPPSDLQGPLTLGDISRMSEEDIMRSWSAVQEALKQQ